MPHCPRVSPVIKLALALFAFAALLPTASLHAYVGPGAGFALVSGFLVIFTTMVLAGLSLLVWPFRMLFRYLSNRKKRTKAHIKRFIVVGLDGQEPSITDRLLKEGKLPNFKKLAEIGDYQRLRTVYPALSPVAWSSFSTGTNPGGHNIFDFVERDRKTYLPKQASTEVGKLEKTLKIGKWRIPLHKPILRLLRKSKPFWTILGEHNIWSTVLRVPITFPPDKFYGAQLSAMMVPDLLGTLGSYHYLSSRSVESGSVDGVGIRGELKVDGDGWTGTLEGPPNSFLDGEPPMPVPVTIFRNGTPGNATVTLGDESISVAPRELSDWVTLSFKAAPGITVTGVCRLMLTELGDECGLYLTPINIDPESPAMPISHPAYYSTYLAKKIGSFATLGLAEDTEAMKEGITDDGTFLQQALDIDDERQEMFFSALSKLRKGSLVCVFDATDRIQHMFWRYIEKGHPADLGNDDGAHRNAIEELYIRNDEFVGKILEKVREGDLLCVMSDHGFTSFRRCVNLNRWLLDEGYLTLKEGATGEADLLRDIDWSQTRAYCLGLAGMFLNIKGREAQGIVEPGDEVRALKGEIISKLKDLRDDEKDEVGINEVFDSAEIYSGPYVGNAPDFIVGYNAGYRTSWDCANGVVAGPVFEDNVKAWSGDHGIDPRMIPGVLFTNRKIDAEDPSILDMAPSALTLFGIKPPKHMEGKPLFSVESLGNG